MRATVGKCSIFTLFDSLDHEDASKHSSKLQIGFAPVHPRIWYGSFYTWTIRYLSYPPSVGVVKVEHVISSDLSPGVQQKIAIIRRIRRYAFLS